jgi:hypothetical protein
VAFLFVGVFVMLEKMYDLNNLYDSFLCVKYASGWKEKTQAFDENLMMNLIDLKNRLMDGGYQTQKPHKFLLSERGKTRLIESYNIEDRIVQNCFMNNILLPICTPKLIYDNSASIKGKGTDFFRRRFLYHLKDYIKHNGCDGYILLCDMSKYFDNIQHAIWLSQLERLGLDNECLGFVSLLLKNHIVDVSYMTDEEYANCMNTIFNSVEYEKIDKKLLTGEKMMEKSIGIGAPIAQGAGITHLYRLDNLCKIVLSHKYYARYQDDFYVMHKDKEYLKYTIERITEQCKELGLFLNTKKTQIVKLSHKFTLLKTQYLLHDGKVFTFPCKDVFKREKKHLNELKYESKNCDVLNGEKIRHMYSGWRGDIARRFGECKSIHSFDDYVEHILEREVC